MTKVHKKALSLFLVFAMVLGMIPEMPAVIAQAATSVVDLAFPDNTILKAGESTDVTVTASFESATAANAWASPSNAKSKVKASPSNGDLEVAVTAATVSDASRGEVDITLHLTAASDVTKDTEVKVTVSLKGATVQGTDSFTVQIKPKKSPDIIVKGIEISGPNTVKEGEKITLTATATPGNATNKAVTWRSNDPDIAGIEPDANGNGVVTGNRKGTVMITAHATDGSGVSSENYEITVTKKEDAAVPVESITLDTLKKVVKAGDTFTVKATVKPDNATDRAVVWSSGNKDVATVENGVVKAVAVGEADITASAGGKSAICTVIVKADTPVEFELGSSVMRLEKGSEKQLNLTIISWPAFGGVDVTKWETSDSKIVDFKDGTVMDTSVVLTAKSTGTATITATINGVSETCKVTVYSSDKTDDTTSKLDELASKIEKASPEEKEAVIKNVIKDALTTTVSPENEEAVNALANLEELIAQNSDKFGATETKIDPDVEIDVNVVGALLNLPEINGQKVHAVITIKKASLPADPSLDSLKDTAVALDISLSYVTEDSSTEQNLTVKKTVIVTTEVPAALADAKNLRVYHYHGTSSTPDVYTPYLDGAGNMSFGAKRFSTFVLVDAPVYHGGGSGGGKSSGFSGISGGGLSGQWIQNASGWWFKQTTGGYPANTWAQIYGKWYHFDAEGYMQTGWLQDGGVWYYLQPSGNMAENIWVSAGGHWYYLHTGGRMLANQWLLYNGQWYYLTSDGSMAVNTTTPDGYQVGSDGVCVQ